MKKIISILAFAVAAALVCGCSKEDTPDKTTYTVKMQISIATADASVKTDITAYEYNEAGEKVANNDISPAYFGTSQIFTASSRAVKVKIYIKMYTDLSSVTPRYRWVQQVYYLEQGKNIDITIEDHTKVGTSEP